MWVRIVVRTLTAATLLVAGCNAMEVKGPGRAASERTIAPAVARRKAASSRPALTTPRSAPAADLQQLEEAILLASTLKYEESTGKLMDLIPRLGAVGDEVALAEATFWLGYCREKQGRPDRAVALYQQVSRQYSATPAAGMARQRLAAFITESPPDRPTTRPTLKNKP
jgi:hypothetical protein